MEYVKYLNKKLIENLYSPEVFSFTLNHFLQKFLNDFSFDNKGDSYINYKKNNTFINNDIELNSINVLTKLDNKPIVWFISLKYFHFVFLNEIHKELSNILENFYKEFSDRYCDEANLLNTLIESCEYFLKHPEKITEIK